VLRPPVVTFWLLLCVILGIGGGLFQGRKTVSYLPRLGGCPSLSLSLSLSSCIVFSGISGRNHLPGSTELQKDPWRSRRQKGCAIEMGC